MALLVHITSLDNEKRIKRSGIKAGPSNVVFFMPHMKEFLISHQWAREIKRFGIKNFIAIDFKISTDEMIWFGRYNEDHQKTTLGKAIGLLMSAEDKLGYEFFIERNITPKELVKFRKIPKPMGWRYEPNAHGKRPCPCPMCIQFGGYKTSGLKEHNEEEMTRLQAKQIVETSNNEDELSDAVRRLQGKWKRESPEYLERLLTFTDEYLLYDLVELLAEYRHPLTKKYLRLLAASDDEDASQLAIGYLRKYNENS
jgi:hypothetical protein